MRSQLFKQFVQEAKERNCQNKEVLAVIEEMEADPSLKSIVEGTLLTLELCKEK